MSCYITLGKSTNYNAEYFFAGEKCDDYTQYNIYHSKKFVFENGRNIAICTTIAKQLQSLLERFSISSTIEVDKRDTFALQEGIPHVFSVIHLPEYSFKIDLTKDLYRVQLGNVVRHFGSNPCSNKETPYKTFSLKELYPIAQEIGYLNEKNAYTNEAWIALRRTIDDSKDIEPKAKLEFLLRTPLRFSCFSLLGPIERLSFTNALLKNLAEQDWIPSIKKTYFKNRTIKTNEAYNTLYSIQDNNQKAHYYIQTSNSLQHYSIDELSTYIENNRIFMFSPVPFLEQREHDNNTLTF